MFLPETAHRVSGTFPAIRIQMQNQLTTLNIILGLLKHLKNNLKTLEEKDKQAEYIIQFIKECISKPEHKSC